VSTETREPDFYASPGPMTTLPDDVDGASADPTSARDIVPRLMIHTSWTARYGLPAATVDARPTHTAQELVHAIRALHDAPLDALREPAQRVGVVCRHFSTMAVALLTRARIPARARCGFADYFEPGKYVDHWIVEWHDGDRWVQSDFQIGDTEARAMRLPFDAGDLPADRFVDAGEAWRRIRAGEAEPDAFGIFDMWGAWFVRANVWRDLAALNKVEMNPWDGWGAMHDAPDDFTDTVAEITRAGTLDARRDWYRDERLRMPGRVTSFLDGADVPVDVAVG
jgi:hypothetical protein